MVIADRIVTRHRTRSPRRALAVALLVVLLAACDLAASPPAPAPVPPDQNAPADTYRGRTEAWVSASVYPALLGRQGGGSETRFWADRVVRSTPTALTRRLSATAEARRHRVVLAYARARDRLPSGAERTEGAARLGAGWSVDLLTASLLTSAEQTTETPDDTAWLTWTFHRLLGRAPNAGGLAYWQGRLAGGTSRLTVARSLLASGEGRAHTATAAHRAVIGRDPTPAERAAAVSRLDATGGDDLAVRADLLPRLAPDGYRVGVVGNSIAFDMVFRARDQSLPAVVTGSGQRPVSGARLGCGVLSTRPGYLWPRDPQLATHPPSAPWGAPGDGRCPTEIPRLEGIMLAAAPQVLVWPIGAWEWTRVRRPDGTILGKVSHAMRSELAVAMVERIDGWRAAGVRHVVLPEWACPGFESASVFRSGGMSRFVRSVIVEVQRRRPEAVTVIDTPPQVCVDGVPTNPPTRDHRIARGDQFHWATGSHGAAWGWQHWFAPAIADLRGIA